MPRSDAETAVEDVNHRLQRMASSYARAARSVHDRALAALFREIGDERAAMVARSAVYLIALGNLPSAADPDRADLTRVARRVKAALSPDKRRLLVRERERDEDALSDAIDAALSRALPVEIADGLARDREAVERARRRLAEARRALERQRAADAGDGGSGPADPGNGSSGTGNAGPADPGPDRGRTA